MQILNGRRHGVASLAFSHCGRWIAAGGGGLHLWDTSRPAEKAKEVVIVSVYRARYVRNLVFRTDGRLFCTSLDAWYLVDPESATPARLTNQRFGRYAVSPDGTRVARIWQSTPIRLYRVGDEKVTPGATVSRGRTFFGAAAFAPGGKTLAVEAVTSATHLPAGRRVELRNANSGKCLATFARAFDGPARLLFSPDGSKLVAVSQGRLACWDVADPEKAPRKATNPSRKHFLSVAFHPDGKLLTVDNDRLVRVWDTGALAAERAIEWNVGKLYAVAASPDGARVAVGSHTGKVLVWDWD